MRRAFNPFVIASEAKQSMKPEKTAAMLDCFVAVARR